MVLFLGTSLSRNFFTDLSRGIVDMPKPRFASTNNQSGNDFFLHFGKLSHFAFILLHFVLGLRLAEQSTTT